MRTRGSASTTAPTTNESHAAFEACCSSAVQSVQQLAGICGGGGGGTTAGVFVSSSRLHRWHASRHDDFGRKTTFVFASVCRSMHPSRRAPLFFLFKLIHTPFTIHTPMHTPRGTPRGSLFSERAQVGVEWALKIAQNSARAQCAMLRAMCHIM